MPRSKVLILGGTGEARALAAALIQAGFEVVSSLAGVTQSPHLPAGEVRIGGFGGEQGLADFLHKRGIEVIADATHPFAATISLHANEAAHIAGARYLRLERPVWLAADGDNWTAVPDALSAARAVPSGARVLLTIGRRELAPFLARSDLGGIARMIEPLEEELPGGWRLLLARPPFSLEDELRLMRAESVTVLVSKNSGGPTEVKLVAARTLGLPVIMIDRPPKPKAETAASVEAFLTLVAGHR